MDLLLRDLVPAARALVGRPRRSLLVVALLALGIGLSTALFSVLDGVALRGLPFPDGDRIVFVSTYGGADAPTPVTDIRHLREGLDRPGGVSAPGPFAELAAFRTFNTVITRPGVGSTGLTATYVTGNLFAMLGTEPVLGRGFTLEDEDPARPAVAVISHGVWRSQFGGRQDVLGETVVVNREPMTIVGVMPEGFGFPIRQEAWVALRWEGRPWSDSPAFVVAKLRPGWSPERAQGALAPLAARLDEETPLPRARPGAPAETREAHVEAYVKTLLPPEIGRSLRLMLWAALGLLLVASANAASLRLADVLARRQELAVRRALGAGSGRLLRMHLAEAGLLAGASAAAGTALAWGLVELTSTALLRGSPLVRQFWVDVRLDLRSCLFAVATAAVALLVGGLIPAAASLRRRDLALGPVAGRRATHGPGASRLAGGLVAFQVALAFALVAGSGLLARSGLSLLAREPGFDPDHLLRVVVSGYQAERETPAARRAFWEPLFERLAGDPEIAGATLAGGDYRQRGVPAAVRRDPADPAALESLPTAGLLEVLPGYFETLRLPLLAGRPLEPSDAPSPDAAPEGELPAVVSASLAHGILGDSPLGATFEAVPYRSRRPVQVRVVGVVADLGLGRTDRPGSENAVYTPGSVAARMGGILLVRGRTGTADLERRVARAVAAVDPRVATLDAETFEEGYAEETWVERRLAQVVSLFGLVSLVLAALGLFAAVDLALEGRARELAVRSALGALPRQLGTLLLRGGVLQAVAGLALGGATLFGASRFLRPFLYQVDPWDPLVMAGAAAGVAAALLAAIAAPALRAARTDPAEALRAE